MNNQSEYWNIFHDGCITEVRGTLPDISLKIEIQYLARMLAENSDSIWVNLSGCQNICYGRWDSEDNLIDFARSDRLDLEILSAQQVNDEVHIFGVGGTLKLMYENLCFSLDSVSVIDWNTIVSAARKYWSTFENA